MVLDFDLSGFVAVVASFSLKILFFVSLQQIEPLLGLNINMSKMISKIQAKTDQAFHEIVRNHSDNIYNLALMKSNQITLAEDICQETFIRVYKGLHSFRQEAQMATWVYRIALNVCHTIMKKELKLQQREIKSDYYDVSEFVDEDSDVQIIHSRLTRKESIRKAISSLPPLQADAITLYYLKDFQYTEVAEIMNIPMNTVKSHLRRAKENLRKLLPEEAL